MTGERRSHKGWKRRVSVPPRVDDIDRPTWALPAPPGARWVEVPDGHGTDPTGYRRGFHGFYVTRLLLPAIPPREARPSYGRSPLEATVARQRVQAVACDIDMYGESLYGIARCKLTFGDFERRHAQARRDYAAGRRSLWREGVLPWAAWPEGLPAGDWRKAPELMAALTEWARDAVRNPAPQPPTRLEMSAATFATALVAARRSLLNTASITTALAATQRAARAAAAETVSPWRYEDTLAAREEAEGEAA